MAILPGVKEKHAGVGRLPTIKKAEKLKIAQAIEEANACGFSTRSNKNLQIKSFSWQCTRDNKYLQA